MSEFGNELRRERESRGIGLDSISEATKISVRHLQALEANKFDKLPGGVFNKGMVRSFARVVGLDEAEWVERYVAAYHGSGLVKDDDASWIEFAENVGKNRPPGQGRSKQGLRWAGVALLLTVLAVLGWYVWHYVSNKLAAETVPHRSETVRAGMDRAAVLSMAMFVPRLLPGVNARKR